MPASTPSSRPGHLSGAAIVEAAWGLVLAAFSGTNDVVFGCDAGVSTLGPAG